MKWIEGLCLWFLARRGLYLTRIDIKAKKLIDNGRVSVGGRIIKE